MLLLCLGLLTFIAHAKRHIPTTFLNAQEVETCYGVIFDAGSSGTRVYVYSWPCRTIALSNPKVSITQKTIDKKVEPGISSFNNSIDGIKAYLDPLIAFAKSNIPEEMVEHSPIILYCTAGMRLLTLEQQENILSEVSNIFSESGFYFNKSSNWTRVISGIEEGAFLWMSANYILGKFSPKNIRQSQFKSTFATVDLGGASTQLAVLLDPKVRKFRKDRYKEDYFTNPKYRALFQLYSHSWLGFGQDQARMAIGRAAKEQFIASGFKSFSNPCFLKGYSAPWELDNSLIQTGTGNYKQCMQLIDKLMFPKFQFQCDQAVCGIQNYPIPTLAEGEEVYAAGAVFFAKAAIKLPNTFTWIDLRNGYRQYCDNQKHDDAELKKSKHYGNICFNGVYTEALLSKGYKLPKNTKIVTGKIGDLEPSWTMAALFDSVDDLNGCPESPLCPVEEFLNLLKEMRQDPNLQEIRKMTPLEELEQAQQ